MVICFKKADLSPFHCNVEYHSKLLSDSSVPNGQSTQNKKGSLEKALFWLCINFQNQFLVVVVRAKIYNIVSYNLKHSI